jgi:hypothetical protein
VIWSRVVLPVELFHHVLRLELSDFAVYHTLNLALPIHLPSRHFVILTNADIFIPFLASFSICIALRFPYSDRYFAYAVVQCIRGVHFDPLT